MKTYEASAKTKEEAIEAGLEALGVGIGDVDVTVLEEGSKGLFGLFGSRMARVRLTVKEAEVDPLDALLSDTKKTAPEKPAKKPAPAVKEEQKPAKEKKTEQPAEKKSEEKKPAEKKTTERAPRKKAEAAETEAPAKAEAAEHAEKPEKPAQKKTGTGKPVERKKEKTEKPAQPRNEQPRNEQEAPAPAAPAVTLEKPEITLIPDEQLDPESPAGMAKAFLADLTRLMGVNVEIAMGTDAEGHVYGQMTGDTLGILIGRRGETLDAIQYLTSLKINRGQENYTRVTLDTENYRAKREDTLIRLANRMANRAVRTGRRVSLEPMNPYERRIIHSALQANDAVDTHSEGEEPNRHVVITLKK